MKRFVLTLTEAQAAWLRGALNPRREWIGRDAQRKPRSMPTPSCCNSFTIA
jgi:hypothetical protein